MAITQAQLQLLNIAHRGTPFADLSVSSINTLLLNTAWRGTPFVARQSTSTHVSVYDIRFDIVTGQMETSFETVTTGASDIVLDLNTGKFMKVITPRIVMTL